MAALSNEQLDELIDKKKEFSALVCFVCYGGLFIFSLVAVICHIISKFC